MWINAADPAQCWGKVLPHKEGRSFLNIPGNAVACLGGTPVAIMERQGKTLRLLETDDNVCAGCIKAFADAYKRGKIFPWIKRIVVKEYSEKGKEALEAAGFLREMRDYVMYR